uniref:Uncharacterized protein n=1 Tax=Timema cristinae TaxID=61476 RepID=A0A7R9GWU9_TIMCR|nr:unnamed protein product [Timema cristinae]
MGAEYSGELITDGLDNMDCGAVQAESELSVDMLNFHEAVSQLQVLEEEVLDAHKSLMEKNPRWMDTDEQLFAMSLQVDYDQDAFSKQLMQRLTGQIAALEDVLNKVQVFREHLAAEEVMSQKMKRPGWAMFA